LTEFTLSFWIKKKSADSLEILSGSNGGAYILCNSNNNPSRVFSASIGEDGSIGAFVSTTEGGEHVSAMYAGKIGYQWQHCAVTYDGR
jgi:hypothetical protein